MYAIRVRRALHRAQGDREDRGRLPRRLRRAAGLGEAGARRDRPGRRAHGRAGARRRRGRLGAHVIAYNDLEQARPGARGARQRDRRHSSSSRSSRTSSIVVPDEGYLAAVRAACDAHGVAAHLRRGQDRLTAGYAGAAAAARRHARPRSRSPSRSVAGCRWPRSVASARSWRPSSTAGWPTSAPTTATRSSWPPRRRVDEICTREALDGGRGGQRARSCEAIDAIIDEYELPAHTVGLGVKGCVTWSTTPVRNYRDYKATDFDLAEFVRGCGASTGTS